MGVKFKMLQTTLWSTTFIDIKLVTFNTCLCCSLQAKTRQVTAVICHCILREIGNENEAGGEQEDSKVLLKCSQGAHCLLVCDIVESVQAVAEELLVMVKSSWESEDIRILEAVRAWDLVYQLELRAVQTTLLGPENSLVLVLGSTPLAPKLGECLSCMSTKKDHQS